MAKNFSGVRGSSPAGQQGFPRQQARTRRFTIGVPRELRVSPDGGAVTFLRTRSGDDPVSCLWQADATTGEERLVADPRALGADDENLPPEERARRERVRETGSGIVAYATDERHTLTVFALSGQVYAAPLGGPGSGPRLMATQTPALDPRPDPAGRRIAYVHSGALRVADLETGDDTIVAAEDGVTFGLAEFVASEEMGRFRGYWWSPDGSRLLVARVDESDVKRWHIADPANPDQTPAEIRYPAAGTPNADVSLLVAELATGTLTPAEWDRAAFPYLVTAAWDDDLLIVTQSRDQKTMRLSDGRTGDVIREDSDPHWTDVIDGVPAQLPGGDIVWTALSEDTRRLIIAPAAELAAAKPLTPPGLQVREVLGTDGDSVLFTGSAEATEVGVWRYGPDGLTPVVTEPGVHGATAAGGTTVVSSRTLRGNHASVRINKNGKTTGEIAVLAEEPNLPHPDPQFLSAGPGDIRTAVLFPSWHRPGAKLPVVMDPYGGPHGQRVLKATSLYLSSQWLAEQGFAVVVADGRGTPGRGPGWDRMVAGDLATGVLEDQVTALLAAAEKFADLDISRVGIRGWSFGGYLAALAVLRRPDVFRAGIAGAPVTDWRLYDTHYTERYLGDPTANPAAYEVSSLVTGDSLTARPIGIAGSGAQPAGSPGDMGAGSPHAGKASSPQEATAVATAIRPLLIIHGLADDNVFVAHSLRLSSALLAAGYPHSVLPLSGVTHMTPQEVVAENLLLLQVSFLREALSRPGV
jgi:dipeptidyl-peptidase 4